MSKASGFYLMYRGWMKHPAFRNNDDRMSWVWLIENAKYSDTTEDFNGFPVKLKRGELCRSQIELAQEWNISRQNVRSILKRFQNWGLITLNTTLGVSVIRINEYGKYQDKPESLTSQSTNEATKGQQCPKPHEYCNSKDYGDTGQPTNQPANQPNPQPDPNQPHYKQNKQNKQSYWWEAEVIKLNRADYEAWFKRYNGTDDQFMDWLSGMDSWLQDKPPETRKRWFVVASSALAKLEGA